MCAYQLSCRARDHGFAGDLLAAIESVNLAAKAGCRAGGLMLGEDGCWVAIGNKPEVFEVRPQLMYRPVHVAAVLTRVLTDVLTDMSTDTR